LATSGSVRLVRSASRMDGGRYGMSVLRGVSAGHSGRRFYE
jgi:hypothetical protein